MWFSWVKRSFFCGRHHDVACSQGSLQVEPRRVSAPQRLGLLGSLATLLFLAGVHAVSFGATWMTARHTNRVIAHGPIT